MARLWIDSDLNDIRLAAARYLLRADRTQAFVKITSMAHNPAGQGGLADFKGRVTTPERRIKVSLIHHEGTVVGQSQQ